MPDEERGSAWRFEDAIVERFLGDLYRVAGDDLADKVIELFEGRKGNAIRWFMAREVPALGYRTLYDACEAGDRASVEGLIYGIEHGVFS